MVHHTVLNEDFFLSTQTGERLYKEYAEGLPVIDYHCHLAPEDIAKDRRYGDITEIWLGGDHYKWRLMRWAGVDEAYITGNADSFEKFVKWAEVLQYCAGNPIYMWSRLELKRYFGYDGLLNPDTAKSVYELCSEKLKSPEMSARGLIRQSSVEYIGTTDDPADSLQWHEQIAADETFRVKTAPTFRPDKAVNIESDGFCDYIGKLSEITGIAINGFSGLKAALSARMDFFAERGCAISDHALDYVCFNPVSDEIAEEIFAKACARKSLYTSEIQAYKTAVMTFSAAEYAKRGWVMQLHYGCNRNVNSLMFKALGENTGFDCISSSTQSDALADFLNSLALNHSLPKTIIYSLNPNDDRIIASIAGCFQESGVKGKVQHGSAWWFNDHADGMRAQLRSLANIGYLPAFVGMLTDSRSFLSYSRHEYFRRILCGLLGEWVEAGEFPRDMKTLGKIVTDISYDNAKEYFGLNV